MARHRLHDAHQVAEVVVQLIQPIDRDGAVIRLVLVVVAGGQHRGERLLGAVQRRLPRVGVDSNRLHKAFRPIRRIKAAIARIGQHGPRDDAVRTQAAAHLLLEIKQIAHHVPRFLIRFELRKLARPHPGHPLLFRQRPRNGQARQEAVEVGRLHRPARSPAGGEVGLEAFKLIQDFVRHGTQPPHCILANDCATWLKIHYSKLQHVEKMS